MIDPCLRQHIWTYPRLIDSGQIAGEEKPILAQFFAVFSSMFQ